MNNDYKYKYILAFDPSGNFHEGKGTTGWVLMDYKENLIVRGYVSAEKYACAEEYWDSILGFIRLNHDKYRNNLIVVIEDYILYREESKGQTNSKMETSRLIGAMQYLCWRLKQPYSMQLASQVKHRWSDELLLRERILYKEGKNLKHTQSGMSLGLSHTRDAFRHAQHYAVCKNSNKPHREQYSYKPVRRSNYSSN